MIEVMENTNGKCVALRVSGKITREDYIGIIPQLERTIDIWNGINLLIKIEQVEGIAMGAVWEDAQFNLKYFREVHRAALVGDQEWLNWVVKISQLFVHEAAQLYSSDQFEVAWKWIKEGEDNIDSLNSTKD